MTYNIKKFDREVSISYPLYQSIKGKYFIGETPQIKTSTPYMLVALVNPSSSNSVIYLNAITVTNIAGSNISAEFYLRSSIQNGTQSSLVSCVNTGVYPAPIPNGQIQYLSTVQSPPSDGVSIFNRIVSPYASLPIDGGQIILAPGSCLIVFLGGFIPLPVGNNAIVAFGWWEEPFEKQCCGCDYH